MPWTQRLGHRLMPRDLPHVVMSLTGRDALLATVSRAGRIEETPPYSQLLEAASDIRPKMIGIASSANVFAGNEVDRNQVQQFIGLLMQLAIRANASVSLIGHTERVA